MSEGVIEEIIIMIAKGTFDEIIQKGAAAVVEAEVVAVAGAAVEVERDLPKVNLHFKEMFSLLKMG